MGCGMGSSGPQTSGGHAGWRLSVGTIPPGMLLTFASKSPRGTRASKQASQHPRLPGGGGGSQALNSALLQSPWWEGVRFLSVERGFRGWGLKGDPIFCISPPPVSPWWERHSGISGHSLHLTLHPSSTL